MTVVITLISVCCVSQSVFQRGRRNRREDFFLILKINCKERSKRAKHLGSRSVDRPIQQSRGCLDSHYPGVKTAFFATNHLVSLDIPASARLITHHPFQPSSLTTAGVPIFHMTSVLLRRPRADDCPACLCLNPNVE